MEGPSAPGTLALVSHSILSWVGTLRHARSALSSLEAELVAEEENLRLERGRVATHEARLASREEAVTRRESMAAVLEMDMEI